jgi:hypothetical protein
MSSEGPPMAVALPRGDARAVPLPGRAVQVDAIETRVEIASGFSA